MTPIRLRSRTTSWAGLALVSTVLLTGCNSVPAFNPGVAARVADDTITVNTVDEVSEAFCSSLEAQPEAAPFPLRFLRGFITGSLALRSAAEQFADELGVAPGKRYTDEAAAAEESLASVPEAQREGVLAVQTTDVYVQEVELAAGQALLEEQGEDGDVEAAFAAGSEAFVAWIDDQDVRIDPKFSVTIENGQAAPTDTSISYPLGATAQQAVEPEPDPADAAALPESQRCG